MQILTQTDKHELRKIVAFTKWYTLRKIGLKFQNPTLTIYAK